jgi:thiol-disulfide isomerase/thioredoxin
MKNHFLGSVLLGAWLLLAMGCGPSQGQTNTAQPAPPAAGTIFPEYKVKTLDGRTEVSLNQYRGKIVILDLFATWCPPCRLEIPHFVELQKTYADRLQIVGLCYDQAPAADVEKFIQQMKINYPVYWGTQEIGDHVNLRGIPTMLLLDQAGREVKTFIGYTPKSAFEKLIGVLSRDQEKKP